MTVLVMAKVKVLPRTLRRILGPPPMPRTGIPVARAQQTVPQPAKSTIAIKVTNTTTNTTAVTTNTVDQKIPPKTTPKNC